MLTDGETGMNAGLVSQKGTVLVIIDVQEKLFANMAEKEVLAENLAKLAQFAHIIKIPIILTEQYPKGLGQTISHVKELVPNLQPIEKVEFSCFGSQRFKEALARTQAETLILAGIETHICVTQTAIDGLENGFRTYVVEDATSSRSLEDKDTAIHRIRQSGVVVVSTEMLIYELLKKAGTPEFKETLRLVR
jgi:nicotinamidase-related amidase